MRILAIDPGVRCCGWALFDEEALAGMECTLLECGLAVPRDTNGPMNDATAFCDMSASFRYRTGFMVVERPQVYRGAKQRGDPNDLIRLAVLCGMLAAGRPHELVKPHDWKGTVPKTRRLEQYVVHRRNLAAIGHEYIPASVPRSLRHNVADAVGLGLWWLRARG